MAAGLGYGGRRRLVALLLVATALAALLVPAAATGVLAVLAMPGSLPAPRAAALAQTTRIYAADGSIIATVHGEIDRRPIALSQMPDHLWQAAVAAEDARFFRHRGVDPRSTARALLADLRTGSADQGGSTITQQYAKQAYVGNEHSLGRKLREARVALKLARSMSRNDILERYLNTAYFGRGAYGVEVAARTYFAKPASALTVSESALLVGLLQAPGRYSPYADARATDARRTWVIERMARLGYLTPAAADEAISERAEPVAEPGAGTQEVTRFPWFVDAVRRYLFDRYGAEKVLEGGLEVHTSLDPQLQQVAEQLSRTTLPDPGDPQAAVVSVEPGTGYVRALVGGGHEAGEKYNVAIQGRRQPGSAFKPFVLVAALQAGMSPRSLVGGMSLESATAASVNRVYERLVRQVGPRRVVEVARQMGIPGPTWLPYQVGCRPLGSDICRTVIQPVPALALGSEEVTPIEMASGFATLAAGGAYREPKVVTKVTDRSGAVLESGPSTPVQAVSPQVAEAATSILRQVIARGTGRRADIGRPAAGKTGTAQDYGNAWFVGYTPELSTAVWVGHRDGNRPLVNVQGVGRVTGGTVPAQMWSNYMGAADLSLAPASPQPALVGQEATYRLTVGNAGPAPAADVRVSDQLPAGARFVSARASQGTCGRSGGRLKCRLGEMAGEASATVDVVVRPTAPGTITSKAEVVGAGFDPEPGNGAAVTQVKVDPAADLSVAASGSPRQLLAGRAVNYTVTVANQGPSPASDVVVTDTLPPGVALVSARGADGPCAAQGQVVTCRVRHLARGARARFQLAATPLVAGVATNTVTVAAREADPAPEGNQTTVGTEVAPAANLSVSAVGPAADVLQGQDLPFALSVVNRGPSPATGVTLAETLPAGLALVSAAPSQGTCGGGPAVGSAGELRCDLGRLENGTTATVRLVLRGTAARGFVTRATVTGRETDLVRADNATRSAIRVRPAADLSVVASASLDPVAAGQVVTYALTLANRGPARATGVTFTGVLPTGVTFVSASNRACGASRGTLTCRVRSLASGAVTTMSVRVRPATPGVVSTAVGVRARQADPQPADNDSAVASRVT